MGEVGKGERISMGTGYRWIEASAHIYRKLTDSHIVCILTGLAERIMSVLNTDMVSA